MKRYSLWIKKLIVISCVLMTEHLFSQEMKGPQVLSEATLDRLSPNSFNRYYKNVHSQCGEDGIAEEIFKRLNITTGFFVELNAADGIQLSNVRNLLEKGWSGVLVEPDVNIFSQLSQTYSGNEKVLCLQKSIIFDGDTRVGQTFDQLADDFFPKQEIDFLSIDIPGTNYLILEGLKRRPKVICLETGLHWHPLFNERIPEEYALQHIQQPLSVIIQIAKLKGYLPLCLTGNLFLVRSDLYEPFDRTPTDVLTLWRDGWRSTFCREWLVSYRASHPFITSFEGLGLQLRSPITPDY